jgi:hypothetical protein
MNQMTTQDEYRDQVSDAVVGLLQELSGVSASTAAAQFDSPERTAAIVTFRNSMGTVTALANVIGLVLACDPRLSLEELDVIAGELAAQAAIQARAFRGDAAFQHKFVRR